MSLFKRKSKSSDNNEIYLEYIIALKEQQLGIKYKAINKAIDLIAKTAAACIIDNYVKKDGKIQELQDIVYYKLNVKPNDNENAYQFWYNFWVKFFNDREALIISLNHKMYIAEDFTYDDTILYEKTYKNIVLKSDNDVEIKLDKTFKSHEVIYLNFKECKTTDLLDKFYREIGNLILIASTYFKHNNITKFSMKYPGIQQPIREAETGKEISREEYKNKIAGSLLSDEEAIVMYSDAFKIDKIESNKSVSPNDYLSLKKEWEESVADSFLIPRDFFFGSTSDKSTSENTFLTYAVKPYLLMLEKEINASLKNKEAFLNGERFKMNLNSIKVYNLLDNATAFDKLYSDGFSHNDIRKLADLMPLDEPWANEHRITKNYSDDVSKTMKGGG